MNESQKDKPVERELDKNVYVLGAGFSAAAGIPMMGAFLREGAKLIKESLAKGHSNDLQRIFHDYLDYVDGVRTIAGRMPFHLEDLEEMFCLLDMAPSEDRRPQRFNSETFIYLIAEILRLSEKHGRKEMFEAENSPALVPASLLSRASFPVESGTSIGRVLERRMERQARCTAYEVFASWLLKPRATGQGFNADAVITTNYDLVMEHAIQSLGCERYTYTYLPQKSKEPNGPIPILKLHGSVNWCSHQDNKSSIFVGCKECTFTDHTSSCSKYRKGKQQLWPAGETATEKTKGTNLLLVPPTWQKGAAQDFLDAVRSQAIRELRSAQRIIIIGYSMPQTDLFFRYLLAHCLDTAESPDIYIVTRFRDPESEQKKLNELQRLFTPQFYKAHVKPYGKGFVNFIRECGNEINRGPTQGRSEQ